jgi:hypothetical protein
MESIQRLHEENKRYYPTDQKGNIDEWGALQKHRVEAYQREQAESQIQKALN